MWSGKEPGWFGTWGKSFQKRRHSQRKIPSGVSFSNLLSNLLFERCVAHTWMEKKWQFGDINCFALNHPCYPQSWNSCVLGLCSSHILSKVSDWGDVKVREWWKLQTEPSWHKKTTHAAITHQGEPVQIDSNMEHSIFSTCVKGYS